jgi:hypothetical protein
VKRSSRYLTSWIWLRPKSTSGGGIRLVNVNVKFKTMLKAPGNWMKRLLPSMMIPNRSSFQALTNSAAIAAVSDYNPASKETVSQTTLPNSQLVRQAKPMPES